MEMQNLQCKKHPQNTLAFFCISNQWHFQPLCIECIPQHTQNHPKKLKVFIESFDKVKQHSKQQMIKGLDLYQSKLNKIQEFQKLQKNDYLYVKQIEAKRMIMHNEIDSYFNDMLNQIEENHKNQNNKIKTNFNNIKQSVIGVIQELKVSQDMSNIELWISRNKKNYLQKDLETYISEIDLILEDYYSQIVQYQPIQWLKDEEMAAQLQQLLKSLTYKNQKVVKKPIGKKKQTGMKKCQQCFSTMQYLTDWKKHLVCLSCGFKTRNYIKKNK